MSTFVAIRSFEVESAAKEVASRLEDLNVRCFTLSKHPNLVDHTWLFVPGDRDIYARQMLQKFPIDVIGKSVGLANIEESEIPAYAARALARHRDKGGLIYWLFILLWPVYFGWRSLWTYISLVGFCLAGSLFIKATTGCPCCRKIGLDKPQPGDSVKCSRCGIRCPTPAE